MNWRLAIVLVLLAGAVLTGWHAWKSRTVVDADAPAEVRSDFILRDFEIIALNGEGQESFALRAPEMQQTPGARTMELATPLFLMPVLPSGHWEVRSKTGWVNENSDLLKLRGNVIATSPMGATRPTEIRTEQLDVYPNDSRATSETLVTVTSPGTRMQGTGMDASLTGKRVQLLSNVSLINDPKRR